MKNIDAKQWMRKAAALAAAALLAPLLMAQAGIETPEIRFEFADYEVEYKLGIMDPPTAPPIYTMAWEATFQTGAGPGISPAVEGVYLELMNPAGRVDPCYLVFLPAGALREIGEGVYALEGKEAFVLAGGKVLLQRAVPPPIDFALMVVDTDLTPGLLLFEFKLIRVGKNQWTARMEEDVR